MPSLSPSPRATASVSSCSTTAASGIGTLNSRPNSVASARSLRASLSAKVAGRSKFPLNTTAGSPWSSIPRPKAPPLTTLNNASGAIPALTPIVNASAIAAEVTMQS